MPDRLMLTDIACPACGSPLVSIDVGAADDPVGRYRLRSADWWARLFGVACALGLLATVYVAWHLWRTGASGLEWVDFGLQAAYAVPLLLFWLVLIARAWVWSRSSRAGRLAACHACGHRWRVWR